MRITTMFVALFSCLSCAGAAAQGQEPAASKSEPAKFMDVEFGGNPLPGVTEVAAIFRRPGQKTLIRHLKLKMGRVHVVVPPGEGPNGATAGAKIFLVAGMKKLEEFENSLLLAGDGSGLPGR